LSFKGWGYEIKYWVRKIFILFIQVKSMNRKENPTMNREKYLEKLRYLRDIWSDEIPTEILHGPHGPQFKVRKAWFQAIYAWIEIGLDKGLVDNEIRGAYQDFHNYIGDSWLCKRLTEKQDIEQGNKVLSSVISRVEQIITQV
jgi:hypothetical protein